MSYQHLIATLAAAAAFSAPLPAQMTVPITRVALQQTFTTGMVGFTGNQTARLNVLNLNSVPATSTTPVANCTVELQFFDAKNKMLLQTVVPNFAPGTATALDLARSAVPVALPLRSEIRGVVTVNPPSPLASPAAVGYCSVMTTLEIFDSTTESTVALTSDTRSVGVGYLVPAIMPAALQ